MTSEAEYEADFFLREVPDVKIKQERKKEATSNKAKEEIKALHISEHSQQLIMETLTYIHGSDYKLGDSSQYEDKELRFQNNYFGQSNLVVKGGFHHTDNGVDTEADKFKMFALLRLESYGFHKNHCIEALDYCKGELEDALYLLYTKYMAFDFEKTQHNVSEDELLEQRQDERGVLESIYEKNFEEKFLNSVWKVQLKLEYLVDMFHPQRNPQNNLQSQSNTTKKKKDMCRGFLAGNCKYGSRCRFSHEVKKEEKNVNAHLNDYTFDLEIRFPPNSKYPYEPPIIFLKTNFSLPQLMGLHICKRLYQEAQMFAQDGIASVYSIVELLKNDEVIGDYIKSTRIKFLLPVQKLFPLENDSKKKTVSKYFRKGVTNANNKRELTMSELKADDKKISQKFIIKSHETRYQNMLAERKNLPAWKLRSDIIDTIRSSQVTVICGETGCGKSTQVPQYLLDDWLSNYKSNNQHIEIVCTQPRRISAIGVSERVADERCERIGGVVGYQIRLENKVSASTRLTFCTTGILLRRLESDPLLSNVSHVIVDEVHERSEDSDFLLLILKELLEVRDDLKVILMSATINAELFSGYFDSSVPIVQIPGRTFPVEQYFLEDILDTTEFVLEENTQYTRKVNYDAEDLNVEFETQMKMCEVTNTEIPKISYTDEMLRIPQLLARYKDYQFKTCKTLFLMDPEKINLDLIECVLTWIVSGKHGYPREGSILIFLPGIAEITALYELLRDNNEFSPRYGKYLVLPLHSSLSSEEQAAIFRKPKEGVRKIVLSTNLAETSITIDDCVFVIDSGKMKEKRFDSNRNMESLDTCWVTRANALQRKGRAGRVMPGVCIHLFTKNRFKHHMLPQPIPEIHRVPLEQLLLHIKVLPNFAERTLQDVIESILEPPVKENVDSAIIRLQDVGAFDKENNLTPLGQHLAALPVDVRIGKLMLYGAIFSCTDDALTLAAALSYKSPFVSPFNKKEEAMEKKKEFAVSHSDHITILMAYKKWQLANGKSRLAGRNFANENYMSLRTLEMMADIKFQLMQLLVSIGFIPIDLGSYRHRTGQDQVLALTGPELNKNSKSIRLITSVLCTALYPNIVKVLKPQTLFLRGAGGTIPIEGTAKDLRYMTIREEVFMHPSSVNFTVKSFGSPYLVYQEKVRTSKIYIRDSSMVPIVPLVLFSGSDVNICVSGGITFVVLCDGWIKFHVEKHQIAEMIRAIRLELLDLLEEKIKDPLLNLLHNEKGERIIKTIIHLATND